jgi:predicted metalloendopeptidase
MRHALAIAGLVCIAASCKESTTRVPVTPPPSDVTAEVATNMDRAVAPCEDFYRFACGGWIDATPLPPDQPRFGRFHVLRERNAAAMRTILENADKAGDKQLGKFWNTCMDEAAVEAAGVTVLAPWFERIDKVGDTESMFALIAELHRRDIRALFDLEVGPDFKQPGQNLAFLGQAGLGLPDRELYRASSPDMLALRERYLVHIERMLALTGMPDAAAREAAPAVLAFETALAEISVPREDLREPETRYHKLDRAGLDAHAALPWSTYFAGIGRSDTAAASLGPASYFAALADLLKKTKPATMRHYLRWQLVHGVADHLPEPVVVEHFEMFGKMLRGQAELAPRWKRCVEYTDRALGELLGRQFVDTQFPGDSREVALGMIRRIEDAFAAGLPKLQWMDPPTREAAKGKMHAIVNKIGYPEAWRDYGALAVGDDHLTNVLSGAEYVFAERVRDIDRAVDRRKWEMTPPTVNAYYNASGNEMVFPAGILQPPFFSSKWPMAMNFGGIGMVMGHELTHGFDDQGRKFDGDGMLRPWWAPQVGTRFEERAACVDTLYSGYEVQPGVHLSGKLTLGENIADLGGIKAAHRGFLEWAADNGVDPHAPAMDGLTHEQLFFVSFGQIWCTKSTPQNDKLMALTDTHSHPQYRVNGPLANMREFGDAFACVEGSPMRPADICEVW